MRVVHSLGWYFPDSTGGTESYVKTLARSLKKEGVSSAIVAGVNGDREDRYDYNSIKVYRYPVYPASDVSELRGLTEPLGIEKFQSIIREIEPDIYHQHTWSRGCGIHHLRYAKKLGLPTVLTVHVANFICIRGNMMLFGKQACDGQVMTSRCSTCWAQGRGAPMWIARRLSKLPDTVGSFMAKKGVMQKFRTPFATRHLVKEHKRMFFEACALADRVVVVASWLYDALHINGLPREHLALIRHGVDTIDDDTQPFEKKSPGSKLRIGFLGRADPIKGIHILVKAIRAIDRDKPVELSIHAIADNEESFKYLALLEKLAAGDNRIHFNEAVSKQELTATLRNFDVLAVPSQCLETGPLVVLDAYAARVPVIGTSMGGIAELVKNNTDGILVQHNDVPAWTACIEGLIEAPYILQKLRDNIRAPRSMSCVANQMLRVYGELDTGDFGKRGY